MATAMTTNVDCPGQAEDPTGTAAGTLPTPTP
jgi:hypothetical protein